MIKVFQIDNELADRMTDKRFTVNYRENTRLYEVKDNLHILDCGGFAIEYNAKKCCDELNALNEINNKQSEIIDWLIGALRDDDKIFKEKGISYVINNTLSDLVNGKISVDELLEEWDNG